MSQKPKKKKAIKASDGLITPEHIEDAQRATMHFGLSKMFAATHIIEPELTEFIAAVAEDVAAHAMIDFDMPRKMAMQLRERIVALGLNVYHAQHSAVYTYYQDLIKDTPAAALDTPFPKEMPEDGEGSAVPENDPHPINPFDAARQRPESDEVWIGWTVQDMQLLRPDWSAAKCAAFLKRHSSKFAAGMLKLGLSLLSSMAADPKFNEVGGPNTANGDGKDHPPK